jgi:MATE family multidrug resistance protein
MDAANAQLPALDETDRPRRPLGELLSLALPTVAQMVSYTLMQFLDTWMLSKVGVTEVTAAGNAGILAFGLISLGVGTMAVVNTLVSQSFGRRTYTQCGPYLWQGIWLSLAYGLLVLPLLPVMPHLMALVGHEPRLLAQESVYLQITLSFGFIKLAQTAVAQFLLAVDRPNAVLVAGVVGVAVNALTAYVMIFGRFGCPALGIVGAAWAQNAGGLVELLVAASFVARPAVVRRYGLGKWRFHWPEARTLLRIGIPAGVQTVSEVMAWAAFSIGIMSRFHTEAMAANIIVFRYMSVSFTPAFGFSTAVTALVGRYIGRGRLDIATARAHLGFVVTLVYMLSCGLVFYLGRNALIGLFSDDPQVLKIGAVMLTFAAGYQLADALYIIYLGGLRGAGDTFVPAVATAGLCWGIVVTGGMAVAILRPDFGPAGPWAMAGIYGVILGLFMLVRFHRGGWRSIHLDAQADSNVTAGSATVAGLQLTAES